MKKYLMIMVLGFTCSGCSIIATRSGPFVTNITGDKNQMVIEKCQLEYKWGLGVITTENCYVQKIDWR